MVNNKKIVYPLFAVFGVEIEYMIVDRTTLNVVPIADQVIYQEARGYVNEISRGDIAWTNELVLHVIELKTDDPASTLENLADKFYENIKYINNLLAPHNACLMPTGAHPWMDPHQEAKLWPHGDRLIYETYNRIFDCRGHGWANLQSTQINLPFSNDTEFAQLHSAIRVLLPIMAALTASTPIIEGELSGLIDTRLRYYGQNQRRIPSIAGILIPEVVSSRGEYEEKILQRMYQDIAAYDPEGTLQEEWLNSRAAIPRFDRDAIEIRILDTQECPLADIACLNFIVAILRALITEKWSSLSAQNQIKGEDLRQIYDVVIQKGQQANIIYPDYLALFGYPQFSYCSVKELLRYLLKEVQGTINKEHEQVLEVIIEQGNLAERMLKALKNNDSDKAIKLVYSNLIDCLAENKLFLSE